MEVTKHLDLHLQMANPAWTGEYSQLQNSLVTVTRRKGEGGRSLPTGGFGKIVPAGNNWSWTLFFKAFQCQHVKEKKKSPRRSFSLQPAYEPTSAILLLSMNAPHFHCLRPSAMPPLIKKNKSE